MRPQKNMGSPSGWFQVVGFNLVSCKKTDLTLVFIPETWNLKMLAPISTPKKIQQGAPQFKPPKLPPSFLVLCLSGQPKEHLPFLATLAYMARSLKHTLRLNHKTRRVAISLSRSQAYPTFVAPYSGSLHPGEPPMTCTLQKRSLS